jgi:predicted house-cleaning noncanonical NTP pyrophosphatase (MazG superfamily)
MSKLVRDKIPEIMNARGQCFITKTTDNDDEFLVFLQKKLLEEVEEFIKASQSKNLHHAKEELADVLEVIETICVLKNYDLDSVHQLKIQKRLEKGGFIKKIVLL